MLEKIISIDTDITQFFNSFHCPNFDTFMFTFSGKFIWVPMYAMILLLFFWKFRVKTAFIYTIGLVLTIVITDQLCGSVFRPLFERLRPANLENTISDFIHIVNNYRGGRYGFPSCHAANSFALATFLCFTVRKSRFVFFILFWALLNSYTRLYLGVHYFGDLTVGAIVGVIVGFVMYFLSSFLSNKLSDNCMRDNDEILTLKYYDPMIIVGALTTILILIYSIF